MKYKSKKESADFIAKQFKQTLKELPTKIDCECGREIPIRFMYRCLYCGIFLCQSCAEIHFGKTREQYNLEKNIQLDFLR